MKNNNLLILSLFFLLAWSGGCAIIAGEDIAATEGESAVGLSFVEMLRNEASLRGEGFREIVYSANTGTSLQRPVGVFADPFRVYVADQPPAPASQHILIFDRGERTVADLKTPAAPSEGKLLSPAGIAVDATGVIFVSDSQQGRVFGYDRNGALLIVIGRMSPLSFPSGLAVDNQRNRLYVADSHAHLVKAFSTMGNHLFDIRGSDAPAEDFKFPAAVAVDRAGNVHILDSQRKRVFVSDPEGRFVRAFGIIPAGKDGSVRPRGLAVDSDGYVYVSDTVNNAIIIFDAEGKYIKTWGRSGKLAGDFLRPAGLFIDNRNVIYIADQENSRVQVFQIMK